MAGRDAADMGHGVLDDDPTDAVVAHHVAAQQAGLVRGVEGRCRQVRTVAPHRRPNRFDFRVAGDVLSGPGRLDALTDDLVVYDDDRPDRRLAANDRNVSQRSAPGEILVVGHEAATNRAGGVARVIPWLPDCGTAKPFVPAAFDVRRFRR
jgi:hypothetical protein